LNPKEENYEREIEGHRPHAKWRHKTSNEREWFIGDGVDDFQDWKEQAARAPIWLEHPNIIDY
jgi:hypothetical protein